METLSISAKTFIFAKKFSMYVLNEEILLLFAKVTPSN